MNIYIVSDVWDRGGSTVIGASIDEAGAKAIADRADGYGGRWGEWVERYDPPLNRAFLDRVALLPDGSQHPSLSQEIVRVPLAGYIDDWPAIKPLTEGLAESVPALMRPKFGEEVRHDPLGILSAVPGPMPSVDPRRLWDDPHHDILSDLANLRTYLPLARYGDVIDAMRLVANARAGNRKLGIPVDQIRVGGGAARRYFEQAAETMAAPDVPRPVPIDGTLIQGLTVIVDPTVPPNVIRIGGVAFVIDFPGPGQMIRLGDEIVAHLEEWGMFTSPPGSDQGPPTAGPSTPRTPDRPE